MTVTTSIVIPAYNESLRLANGYERLRPVLEELGVASTEVIVVDDGSSDDTLHAAHDVYGHLPERLFVQQPRNFGKGAAVRLGIALARGEHVIAADADMAIRPAYFPQILEALAHAPLAPGFAHEPGTHQLRVDPSHRGGRRLPPVSCATTPEPVCATPSVAARAFSLGPARLLALLGMVDRFAYDAEIFFLADQLGLAISPVTVTWDDIPGSSVQSEPASHATCCATFAHLARTRYENPVVELESDVDARSVACSRAPGASPGSGPRARSSIALLVLPRDGALGGLGVAAALKGRLRTARTTTNSEDGHYEAV